MQSSAPEPAVSEGSDPVAFPRDRELVERLEDGAGLEREVSSSSTASLSGASRACSP